MGPVFRAVCAPVTAAAAVGVLCGVVVLPSEGAAVPVGLNTTPGGLIAVGSGQRLTDTASLSGAINPTGTLTFTLVSPANTTVDTETVPVNGNGTYSTPTGFFPTFTGTYDWSATYNGDSNNPAIIGSPNPEQETVVRASPAVTGFNPTATLTFTLVSPANPPVDTDPVVINGDGTYSTPIGFLPTSAGTYDWLAVYSGDVNNDTASENGESVTVTAVPEPRSIVALVAGLAGLMGIRHIRRQDTAGLAVI